jgi:hypothetical protein
MLIFPFFSPSSPIQGQYSWSFDNEVNTFSSNTPDFQLQVNTSLLTISVHPMAMANKLLRFLNYCKSMLAPTVFLIHNNLIFLSIDRKLTKFATLMYS